MKWLCRAADWGFEQAQLLVAKLLRKDGKIKEQRKYLQMAAENNNPNALFSLALSFSDTKYIGFDIVKAIDYYKKAEENGADYVAFGPMYETMSKLKKVVKTKKIEA